MKNSTFTNRVKKAGFVKNSNGFRNAEALLELGQKQYTCHASGSGRFTTNIDSTDDTVAILIAAGLKQYVDFNQDNDSPRGGKTYNFVELTSNGRRKMIK